MTRVACVLARTDEALLRPWLLYHGYVFGFENLHVGVVGSSHDEVLAILREFSALGVHVVAADASGDGVDTGAIDHQVGELRKSGHYNGVLVLACDEFAAVNGRDGIACNRTAILDEIRRIDPGVGSCKVQSRLESLPGHLDLFRYLATDSPGAERSNAALISIRLGRGAVDQDHYRLPLLRFGGLIRLLGAVGDLAAFQATWKSLGCEAVPQAVLEVDLDRHPFHGSSYLEANPDLAGLEVDLLTHFLVGGYVEGRCMEATEAGRVEVVERMAVIREHRRDGSSGYVGLANALGALRRADEGDAILEQGIRQSGATAELVREYALLATVREAYGKAARRWDVFRCLFPADPEGYLYGAAARRLRGDLVGAQRVVTAGMERFPQHAGFTVEQRETVFLLRLRQLEESDTHEVFQMDGPVDVLMSEAQTQAALRFLDLADVEALRDFFLGFESLGHSCEFGLVQRRFGADPLGLLRWNSIHAAKLTEALGERFSGFDVADNLTLVEMHDEYVLRDFRYHTAMHTFYRRTEIDAETLMRQMLKRMSYLRGKLIADLEQGEKISVHLDDRALTGKELERLGRAVRAYGESTTLFYVRVADRPSQVGAVEGVGDGVFSGYIDRLGRGADGEWDISFDCWLALCREVGRHARSITTGVEMRGDRHGDAGLARML